MIFTLAENEYTIRGLHNSFVRGAFTWPITHFFEEGFAEIKVPEIIEPVENSSIVLRGSSIQLIALLQSGTSIMRLSMRASLPSTGC
jgi:hypothetical protein